MESIGKQGEEIAQKSAEVIKSAWSGLMGFFANLTYLAVIPIYLFYFLSSNRNLIDDLEGELGFLESPSVKEDVVFLIREFVGIMVAFFRGQLMIGLLMGIGYAIGFTLSGLKFGIALACLFGLLNIVPYLGSISRDRHRPSRCLPSTRRNFRNRGMDCFAWLRCFLCGRPVDRELLLRRLRSWDNKLVFIPSLSSYRFFSGDPPLGGILGMIFDSADRLHHNRLATALPQIFQSHPMRNRLEDPSVGSGSPNLFLSRFLSGRLGG